MSAKKIFFIVFFSVAIAVVTTLSHGIINPFKRNKETIFQQQVISAPAVDDSLFYEKLLALHHIMPMPGPYDWLAQHPEPGQPYSDYIKENPVVPDEHHQVIYITLLGEFTADQKKIIDLTAEFIQIYYMLPVKFTQPIPLDSVAPEARRIHPGTKDRQILAPYVLENLLPSIVPKDAFCSIAFTGSDLWPGEGWNFVFGLASMEDRMGIWSIYRNGDPSQRPADFMQCLRRTLKTGTHEIGHMFSLQHCIYFRCNMNGSNHRKESDGQPLWLCPVCLKKLQWAEQFDLADRYQKLIDFCKKNGLEEEADFYIKSKEILDSTH